jgi:hypothetical protein
MERSEPTGQEYWSRWRGFEKRDAEVAGLKQQPADLTDRLAAAERATPLRGGVGDVWSRPNSARFA